MRYEISTVQKGHSIIVRSDRETAFLLLREWAQAEPNLTTCRDLETGTSIVAFVDVPCCAKHTFRTTTPSGRPVCDVCGFEEEPPMDRDLALVESVPDELDPGQRGHCPGHVWVYTGAAYGGDDESYHGEGRCYCEICGADGDA